MIARLALCLPLALPKVVAVTPSRGLIDSRTVEAVCRELGGRTWLLSHVLPIPDSFEWLTEEALKLDPDAIWYVEEDIVVHPGTLNRLLDEQSDLVLGNYALRPSRGRRVESSRNTTAKSEGGESRPAYAMRDGRPLWLATGCLLVRREAYSRISKPFFRSGFKLVSYTSGSAQLEKGIRLEPADRDYGGQDLYFSWRLLEAGCSWSIVEGWVDHRASEVSELTERLYGETRQTTRVL